MDRYNLGHLMTVGELGNYSFGDIPTVLQEKDKVSFLYFQGAIEDFNYIISQVTKD